MTVLVTGAAGFIGYHVAERLIARGETVVGVDNLNDYYDVRLKTDRLEWLEAADHGGAFTFLRADIADDAAMEDLFARHGFDRVIHLAAQAGVRHSVDAPREYARANLLGFLNVLEGCRHCKVGHLVYASTSSVYGANTRLPFGEADGADHPLQFYAATKRANELMAHSYSNLFGLPTTGLRFFTVYGPWGRPDMAPVLFARKILAGEPIPLFNYGDHSRDFTYVDDVAEGVVRVADRPATGDPAFDPAAPRPDASHAPFRVYNIGNGSGETLAAFVEALEANLGRTARREFLPLQPGDVPDTLADVTSLHEAIGWRPATPLAEGVARFASWYLSYYGDAGPPVASGAVDDIEGALE